MEIATIGFTRKSAEEFFGILRRAGVQRLIDVRLHNASQLAGFTKKDDLAYFARELCGIEYIHEPLLAPTPDMLTAYRKLHRNWHEYETAFLELLARREIEKRLDRSQFNTLTVLLCSEQSAQHCHRRLVVEYLQRHWWSLDATHL